MASSNEVTVSLNEETSFSQSGEVQSEVNKSSENPKSPPASFSSQNYTQGLTSSSMTREALIVEFNDAGPATSFTTPTSEMRKEVTGKGRH